MKLNNSFAGLNWLPGQFHFFEMGRQAQIGYVYAGQQ
jgi:hypothetical protein